MREDYPYEEDGFYKNYKPVNGEVKEHHEVPKTKCVICGEPMDEHTEYIDACSFCLEDIDCMIDEPLGEWREKQFGKAIHDIIYKGFFGWIRDEYPELSINDVTSLIFEGVERAYKRHKDEDEERQMKGAVIQFMKAGEASGK